jgi:hypothetical protein
MVPPSGQTTRPLVEEPAGARRFNHFLKAVLIGDLRWPAFNPDIDT